MAIDRLDVMIDDQQEGSDEGLIELIINVVIFISYCVNYSSHRSRNCTLRLKAKSLLKVRMCKYVH